MLRLLFAPTWTSDQLLFGMAARMKRPWDRPAGSRSRWPAPASSRCRRTAAGRAARRPSPPPPPRTTRPPVARFSFKLAAHVLCGTVLHRFEGERLLAGKVAAKWARGWRGASPTTHRRLRRVPAAVRGVGPPVRHVDDGRAADQQLQLAHRAALPERRQQLVVDEDREAGPEGLNLCRGRAAF